MIEVLYFLTGVIFHVLGVVYYARRVGQKG